MASLGLFNYNSRGFSFEVQDSCKNMSTPVNCNVQFNGSNIATAFGLFHRNEFEPNADIAGFGIFVALLFQAFLIFFLLALAFWYSDMKKRPVYYQTLFSISDLLTILAVAYIVNFLLTGKCVMSTYHYYVALDSVLVAGSTILVTFTTSGHLYWRTFAWIPRLFSTAAIFILLGILLGYQMFKHGNTDFPEWWPPTRNDSALLLPASCFFDSDLIANENPYSPNRKRQLTDAQLDRIGRPVKSIALPELWLYAILAVLFFFGNLVALVQLCCSSSHPHKKEHSGRQNNGITIFRIFIFCACLATNIYCAWHIDRLRAWAKSSGWLKDNSEDEWFSLSQLIPLLALAGFLFLILDHFETGGNKSRALGNTMRMKQSRNRGYKRV